MSPTEVVGSSGDFPLLYSPGGTASQHPGPGGPSSAYADSVADRLQRELLQEEFYDGQNSQQDGQHGGQNGHDGHRRPSNYDGRSPQQPRQVTQQQQQRQHAQINGLDAAAAGRNSLTHQHQQQHAQNSSVQGGSAFRAVNRVQPAVHLQKPIHSNQGILLSSECRLSLQDLLQLVQMHVNYA